MSAALKWTAQSEREAELAAIAAHLPSTWTAKKRRHVAELKFYRKHGDELDARRGAAEGAREQLVRLQKGRGHLVPFRSVSRDALEASGALAVLARATPRVRRGLVLFLEAVLGAWADGGRSFVIANAQVRERFNISERSFRQYVSELMECGALVVDHAYVVGGGKNWQAPNLYTAGLFLRAAGGVIATLPERVVLRSGEPNSTRSEGGNGERSMGGVACGDVIRPSASPRAPQRRRWPHEPRRPVEGQRANREGGRATVEKVAGTASAVAPAATSLARPTAVRPPLAAPAWLQLELDRRGVDEQKIDERTAVELLRRVRGEPPPE